MKILWWRRLLSLLAGKIFYRIFSRNWLLSLYSRYFSRLLYIETNCFFKEDERLKKFNIYLDRHIELDGDCHSILAKKLVASLCKSEEDWQLAEKWATFARLCKFFKLFWICQKNNFSTISFQNPNKRSNHVFNTGMK